MAKVQVEWLGGQVHVPQLDKTIADGDTLEMEESEARDREAAGQVKIKKGVARATPKEGD